MVKINFKCTHFQAFWKVLRIMDSMDFNHILFDISSNDVDYQ